jgi:hypothetical protein
MRQYDLTIRFTSLLFQAMYQGDEGNRPQDSGKWPDRDVLVATYQQR